MRGEIGTIFRALRTWGLCVSEISLEEELAWWICVEEERLLAGDTAAGVSGTVGWLEAGQWLRHCSLVGLLGENGSVSGFSGLRCSEQIENSASSLVTNIGNRDHR